MVLPRNFVGVVGAWHPTGWQSFSKGPLLGPSNPLSRLSQRQSGAHLLAACPAHNDRVVKDKSYAVGRATTALRLADLADRRVDRTTPDCSSRHCYAHVLTTRNPKQSCAASDHAHVWWCASTAEHTARVLWSPSTSCRQFVPADVCSAEGLPMRFWHVSSPIRAKISAGR